MFVFALVLGIAAAMSSQAWAAESQVWIRNHTSQSLRVDETDQSNESWTRGREWRTVETVIGPGEVAEVMRFSRRKRDIKSKPIHLVNRISVDGIDTPLELRTVLKRSFCSTAIESGLGGMGASEVRWGDGTSALSVRRLLPPRSMKRFPFCQGGDERVEVVVETVSPLPAPPKPGPDSLHVMAYNIWYLLGKPRQSSRWKGIVDVVKGNDVVVFSEAFKGRYRALIIDRIRDEYPYITRVISGGSVMNGGVFVASRWPFDGLEPAGDGLYSAPQRIFPGSQCAGEDCWAAKGVQYVVIKKNGRRYHLFASHLQSTDPLFKSNRLALGAMMSQTETIGGWVKEMNISEDEPVLIAGDLNFDGNDPDMSARVLENLGSKMPSRVGEPLHTFWMANPTSPKLALDHVLYSRHHRAPVAVEQVTVVPAGMLSDHFPVRAMYRFGEP